MPPTASVMPPEILTKSGPNYYRLLLPAKLLLSWKNMPKPKFMAKTCNCIDGYKNKWTRMESAAQYALIARTDPEQMCMEGRLPLDKQFPHHNDVTCEC